MGDVKTTSVTTSSWRHFLEACVVVAGNKRNRRKKVNNNLISKNEISTHSNFKHVVVKAPSFIAGVGMFWQRTIDTLTF